MKNFYVFAKNFKGARVSRGQHHLIFEETQNRFFDSPNSKKISALGGRSKKWGSRF